MEIVLIYVTFDKFYSKSEYDWIPKIKSFEIWPIMVIFQWFTRIKIADPFDPLLMKSQTVLHDMVEKLRIFSYIFSPVYIVSPSKFIFSTSESILV